MTASKASPLESSLRRLLRSKSIESNKISIVVDNAKQPTAELVEKVTFDIDVSFSRCSLSSESSAFDEDGDSFIHSSDFDLPVWELDASADPRWSDQKDIQPVQPSRPLMSPVTVVVKKQRTTSIRKHSSLDHEPRRNQLSVLRAVSMPSHLKALPRGSDHSSGSTRSAPPSTRLSKFQIADILDESIALAKATTSSSATFKSPTKQIKLQPQDSSPLIAQCRKMNLVF